MKNKALLAKQNFADNNQLLIRKMEKTIKQLQEEQEDTGFSNLKQIVGKIREMMIGLAPKDIYYQLKDVAEKQLKSSEYLLVKVFELIEPY